MKKTLLAMMLMITGLVATIPVHAVVTLRQITINPTKAVIRQQLKVTITEMKRDNAYKEIDRRVASLNELINRINALKRLSAENKAKLVEEVNAEITNLNNLYQKIAADTDLTTLKADKKSIVDAYRVFVLFMPKISIIAHADMILDTAAVMQAKNPTGDAATKIADAITQANSAIAKVIDLEPSGWPGNKSDLESAKAMLQVARQDLNSAWVLVKASVPLPSEISIINTFFELMNEGRASSAVSMLDSSLTSDDASKQAWGVQFNAFKSIKAKSVTASMSEEWSNDKHTYKVILDVTMKPEAASAQPIPNYGYENGENYRWVTLFKAGNIWKIGDIATGP